MTSKGERPVGRPATGRTTGTLAIRLPMDVVERVRARAAANGVSVSEYVTPLFMMGYRNWFAWALLPPDTLEQRRAMVREASRQRAEKRQRLKAAPTVHGREAGRRLLIGRTLFLRNLVVLVVGLFGLMAVEAAPNKGYRRFRRTLD